MMALPGVPPPPLPVAGGEELRDQVGADASQAAVKVVQELSHNVGGHLGEHDTARAALQHAGGAQHSLKHLRQQLADGSTCHNHAVLATTGL